MNNGKGINALNMGTFGQVILPDDKIDYITKLYIPQREIDAAIKRGDSYLYPQIFIGIQYEIANYKEIHETGYIVHLVTTVSDGKWVPIEIDNKTPIPSARIKLIGFSAGSIAT